MDINMLAQELAKLREALTLPVPDHAKCPDCDGRGVTQITRSVVDHEHGGFHVERDEICESCGGDGF